MGENPVEVRSSVETCG